MLVTYLTWFLVTLFLRILLSLHITLNPTRMFFINLTERFRYRDLTESVVIVLLPKRSNVVFVVWRAKSPKICNNDSRKRQATYVFSWGRAGSSRKVSVGCNLQPRHLMPRNPTNCTFKYKQETSLSVSAKLLVDKRSVLYLHTTVDMISYKKVHFLCAFFYIKASYVTKTSMLTEAERCLFIVPIHLQSRPPFVCFNNLYTYSFMIMSDIYELWGIIFHSYVTGWDQPAQWHNHTNTHTERNRYIISFKNV